jgi:hypothetical protein
MRYLFHGAGWQSGHCKWQWQGPCYAQEERTESGCKEIFGLNTYSEVTSKERETCASACLLQN